MEFLLLFIIIISISISIRFLLKRRIEEIIPLTVVLTTIIIYLTGLIDNLNLGVKLVETLTVFSIIFNIFKFRKIIKEKKLKEELKKILTPGLFIYSIFYLIFIFINYGRVLEDYDEFNHWGLIIKNMYYYNGYGTLPNSKVTFNEYPPFTATFAYLLLKIKGAYLEGHTLISQNLLYLSFIIPITSKIEFKLNFENLKKIILFIVFFIITPIAFYINFFSNLLVDGLLGILFGMGLFIIYKDDDDKLYKNIFLVSIITSLSLIKTSGILFSCMLLLCLLIKEIINKDYKILKLTGILILLPIILTTLWYIKINLSNKGTEWNYQDAVNAEYHEKNKDVLTDNFLKAITNKNEISYRELSLLTLILIVIIYSIYVYSNLNKSNKKKYLYIILFHTITLILFMIGLWWTYLTLFIEYESSILACWWRYTATVLISWTMLNNFILLNIEKNKLFPTIILIIIFSLFMPFKDTYEKYIEKDKKIESIKFERNNYISLSNYLNKINKEDKIFYVSKLMTPFILKINKYEFLDYNIANKEANIEYSSEEFAKILIDEKYDYVYLYRMFYDFDIIYNDLFASDIINDRLYKVTLDENKKVKLKIVD